MVEVSISTLWKSNLPLLQRSPNRAHLRAFISSQYELALTSSTDAFNRYSPIAIFVNIPATIFATAIYEMVLRDSFAIIAKGHNIHKDGEEGLTRHLTKVGTLEQGVTNTTTNGSEYANGKNVSPV
jgi:hypothetical protein